MTTPTNIISQSKLFEISTGCGDAVDFVQIIIKLDRTNDELFGYDIVTGCRYSIKELEQLANNGNIHAQCAMGDYHSSEGESFNPRKAGKWYEKAAVQGHAKAQGLFAGFCISGLGVKKDIKNAEFWAKKSAGQNSPTGMSIMSHYCLVKDDYSGAVCWLEKAIEYGYPDAESLLEELKKLQKLHLGDSIHEWKEHRPEIGEEIIHMLQTMRRDYPEAFSCPHTFNALASDLLRNDYGCRGIVRWLGVLLFELNALPMLKDSRDNSDIFTEPQLVDKLISEGASREIAKEAISYLIQI